jgi:hypothetical protein
MNEQKKTETLTLAAAMDVLAREIQCADGAATAAIAEAAQRLRELEWEVACLTQQMRTNHEQAEEIIRARESEISRQHDKIGRLTVALKDAIGTYDPDRDVTLVTAERQEAWHEALKY